MRADPQPQAGLADRDDVGRVEIFLAEMDEVATAGDRLAPMIIDDELRAIRGTKRLGQADLADDFVIRCLFEPQLHQPQAMWQQTLDPGDVVDDQIDALQHAAQSRKAMPSTGVEGIAMSRGSIGSAR